MADALDLGLVLEQLLALDSGCVGFGVGRALGFDPRLCFEVALVRKRV